MMKKYIQHEFLKISNFTTQVWEHPLHNHNHFEIVFIHKGKGSHCLSGVHYPYRANSIFLLAPDDIHRFIIEEETEFTFLKFTNVYFKNIENIQAAGTWNQDMDEFLIHAAQHRAFNPENSMAAHKINQLIGVILSEWKETHNESSDVIVLLIRALLLIIKKGMCSLTFKSSGHHASKITGIINYIHEHIYNTELIQITHLARQSGYSKHYLGLFFKEHTGITLRDYISQYKLNLVVNRLKHSSFSIKEISQELGFTDMSHFNKFFKQHKGINPTEFRNKNGLLNMP